MLQFRIDDFPGTKPEEFFKHNLDSFKRFDEVLEKNGVKEYYLGVIPRHVTQEQLKYLSTNPRVIVAMHGVDHDERFLNEFKEHQTFQDIKNAISSVKTMWDPIVGPIDSYIPPHNVIDAKTVKALADLKFKKLFSGPGSDESKLVLADFLGLDVVRNTDRVDYGRSDELLRSGMDKVIRELALTKRTTLTLHFPWEVNIGLDHLDRFLKEIFR